ncbi:MAG TPA: glycosyltransferase [Dongiaceae bacterium]|nr:glycosyltransferase [Dongiaceae bacterium]
MINSGLRVAFFPDCYHEIDGVANTARQFEAFAIRHSLPFLTVHGGAEDNTQTIGPVTRVAHRRGPFGFALDKKHDFDLAFWRYLAPVENAVREFDPDLIHITGPSDVGQLGLAIAQRLRVPLAASWHTNVHEYAQQRANALLSFLPPSAKHRMGKTICQASLNATLRFYRIAQVLFAPNRELIELLEKGTGKPVYPMHRGVDTTLFDPARRVRDDDGLVVAYVGRLTVEKNIHFLAELEKALLDGGLNNFRFLIVGQGAEEAWLKANMRHATFTGVLRGEALATAYANMDVFAFPSRTDTYGNVVLEALASGVPAVVTDGGGPRFIVRHGETGFITHSSEEFVACVRNLASQPAQLQRMREAARAQALGASWDAVFESVYRSYQSALLRGATTGRKDRIRAPRALPLS